MRQPLLALCSQALSGALKCRAVGLVPAHPAPITHIGLNARDSQHDGGREGLTLAGEYEAEEVGVEGTPSFVLPWKTKNEWGKGSDSQHGSGDVWRREGGELVGRHVSGIRASHEGPTTSKCTAGLIVLRRY